MTEAQAIDRWETLDEEDMTTVQLCPCGTPEMLIRDPRRLSTGSVFAWCPACGCTYSVMVLRY